MFLFQLDDFFFNMQIKKGLNAKSHHHFLFKIEISLHSKRPSFTIDFKLSICDREEQCRRSVRSVTGDTSEGSGVPFDI